MARIVYRGAYATFPVVGLTAGDLAYATDLLTLFEWSGTAWIPYHDYPDYQGGKQAIYLAPHWSALEATDISLTVTGVIVGFGNIVAGTYTVTIGRTFYITDITAFWRANLVANANNQQHALILLTNNTTGVSLLWLGGNGGASVSLAKPLVLLSGEQLSYDIENRANHDLWGGLVVLGYEI